MMIHSISLASATPAQPAFGKKTNENNGGTNNSASIQSFHNSLSVSRNRRGANGNPTQEVPTLKAGKGGNTVSLIYPKAKDRIDIQGSGPQSAKVMAQIRQQLKAKHYDAPLPLRNPDALMAKISPNTNLLSGFSAFPAFPSPVPFEPRLPSLDVAMDFRSPFTPLFPNRTVLPVRLPVNQVIRRPQLPVSVEIKTEGGDTVKIRGNGQEVQDVLQQMSGMKRFRPVSDTEGSSTPSGTLKTLPSPVDVKPADVKVEINQPSPST
ncbi:MAG: hypothetical protein KTR14_01320 [Vampirovibrio sp.]|nr:hypothetical protein [Vampirovibrio sp.]